MTVILVGVGSDEEHAKPAPQINEDGTYEYIPIPETWLTTEERTYGSLELDHNFGNAADVIERIRPFGTDGDWITAPEIIRDHPLHYDPDFESFTFGDRVAGGGKGGILRRKLKPGDLLGFYTGLRGPDGHLHRYIYGYFTVSAVDDLSQYEGKEYRDRLRNYPDNAHAKRLMGAGAAKHDDLVIVDGEAPGDKLKYPYRMSEHRENRPPTYQLTQQFTEDFAVSGGVKAIDRKPALVCDLSPDEFINRIEDRTT
jgi:hypothetical protein